MQLSLSGIERVQSFGVESCLFALGVNLSGGKIRTGECVPMQRVELQQAAGTLCDLTLHTSKTHENIFFFPAMIINYT